MNRVRLEQITLAPSSFGARFNDAFATRAARPPAVCQQCRRHALHPGCSRPFDTASSTITAGSSPPRRYSPLMPTPALGHFPHRDFEQQRATAPSPASPHPTSCTYRARPFSNHGHSFVAPAISPPKRQYFRSRAAGSSTLHFAAEFPPVVQRLWRGDPSRHDALDFFPDCNRPVLTQPPSGAPGDAIFPHRLNARLQNGFGTAQGSQAVQQDGWGPSVIARMTTSPRLKNCATGQHNS